MSLSTWEYDTSNWEIERVPAKLVNKRCEIICFTDKTQLYHNVGIVNASNNDLFCSAIYQVGKREFVLVYSPGDYIEHIAWDEEMIETPLFYEALVGTVKKLEDSNVFLMGSKVLPDYYLADKRNTLKQILLSILPFQKLNDYHTVNMSISIEQSFAVIETFVAAREDWPELYGKFIITEEQLKRLGVSPALINTIECYLRDEAGNKLTPKEIDNFAAFAELVENSYLKEYEAIKHYEENGGYYINGEKAHGTIDLWEDTEKAAKMMASVNNLDIWNTDWGLCEVIGSTVDNENFKIVVASDKLIIIEHRKKGDYYHLVETFMNCLGIRQVKERVFVGVFQKCLCKIKGDTYEEQLYLREIKEFVSGDGFSIQADDPTLIINRKSQISESLIEFQCPTLRDPYSLKKGQLTSNDLGNRLLLKRIYSSAGLLDVVRISSADYHSFISNPPYILALAEVDSKNLIGKVYNSYTDSTFSGIKTVKEAEQLLAQTAKWHDIAMYHISQIK